MENGIFAIDNAPDWLETSLEDLRYEEASDQSYDLSHSDDDDMVDDL